MSLRSRAHEKSGRSCVGERASARARRAFSKVKRAAGDRPIAGQRLNLADVNPTQREKGTPRQRHTFVLPVHIVVAGYRARARVLQVFPSAACVYDNVGSHCGQEVIEMDAATENTREPDVGRCTHEVWEEEVPPR